MTALTAAGKPVASITWTAPSESAQFREPADRDFLVSIGLAEEADKLSRFWPIGGPSWDALAVLGRGAKEDGVLLVEAKSYPDEVYGPGCQARDERSLMQIQGSLQSAQGWFGVARSRDWTGRLYQYANRLAHVYFLRQHLNVEAWLLNVCFCGDETTRATSADTWHKAWPTFRRELGFDGPVPWVVDVMLPALGRAVLGINSSPRE